MPRFWVYIGDQVQGPLDVPSLSKVSGFNLLTQVCEEGGQSWRMADEVIEIKSYLLAPPRPNSFALDFGNAAPKLELPPAVPVLEELTMPEPNLSWQDSDEKTPVPMAVAKTADAPAATGPGASLRAICKICGFKNPRDVALCMKCGEEIKTAGPVAAPPARGPAEEAVVPPPVAPVIAMPKVEISSPSPAVASAATIDIPIPKVIALICAAAVVVGGMFGGIRTWKKRQRAKMAPVAIKPATVKKIVKNMQAARPKSLSAPKPKAVVPPVEGMELPGVPAREEKTEEVPYHVVAEATPLKNRTSAPLNSEYTAKRRADKTLWNQQEEQAIRQVQRNRIYGGQRTIERNAEILMQILRDREYSTAFEKGKRVYLYNDVDWGAVMLDGPAYEVRLTFSGGREADGSPQKPLNFAFKADLERGTVEPGGQGQIRSNTLHAFFDESRIPPEERRPIAKDTEEVVLAAQPGASPLALDTVVRQFAKVYTTGALTRVADAYTLPNVTKKLMHDTRLTSDASIGDVKPGQVSAPKPKETPVAASPVKENKPVATPFVAKGGAVDFRMEKGANRQRTFILQATSKASPEKLWEIATGYDRLKQFVPDMLVSEREGQDGSAVIVHTVYLTRYMFFVFKINLHLRVIEQMRDRTLQFERIAGEFESFRGSLQFTTDPATKDTRIAFHVTVVPTSRAMNWTLEKMAKRLLVGQMEAIRAKAESL